QKGQYIKEVLVNGRVVKNFNGEIEITGNETVEYVLGETQYGVSQSVKLNGKVISSKEVKGTYGQTVQVTEPALQKGQYIKEVLVNGRVVKNFKGEIEITGNETVEYVLGETQYGVAESIVVNGKVTSSKEFSGIYGEVIKIIKPLLKNEQYIKEVLINGKVVKDFNGNLKITGNETVEYIIGSIPNDSQVSGSTIKPNDSPVNKKHSIDQNKGHKKSDHSKNNKNDNVNNDPVDTIKNNDKNNNVNSSSNPVDTTKNNNANNVAKGNPKKHKAKDNTNTIDVNQNKPNNVVNIISAKEPKKNNKAREANHIITHPFENFEPNYSAAGIILPDYSKIPVYTKVWGENVIPMASAITPKMESSSMLKGD
ncbi:MAG: hypothetical protein ACRC41_10285, partial [Sarcina sp.]